MTKNWKRWGAAGLLLALLVMAAAGCGSKDKEDADETASVVYPVTVDGAEVRVGETTVQTLLDRGLRVTVSEMVGNKQINEYEIDPEVKLDGNSYYSGGSVWLSDSVFMHISMVTPEDKAVRMGDAAIAYMEFSLTGGDEADLAKIELNGVPVTEITREKAGEMFPDFTGDDIMWFSPASMTDYSYFTAYDMDGKMVKFSVEKKYDVDWNSEN